MVDPTELAERVVQAHGVPGLALGILEDGRRATGAAGVVDVLRPEPLGADGVFRVASLTKPVVATVLLGLVSEGLLGLDEPMASLPAVPATWAVDPAITLRHLLGHRSGLHPDLGRMERFGEGADALDAAVAHVLGRRRRTAPGRTWWYANSGYWLAGAIAARTLGTTFEAAVEDRVLARLGMSSTSFAGPSDARPVPGHEAKGQPAARVAYPRSRRPSGGLFSTTTDFLRFAEAFVRADGRPVSADVLAALVVPTTPTTWGTRYGLGWEVASSAGERILSHDGSWGGYAARLLVVPGHRFAFVALANATWADAAIDDVERELLRPQGLSRGSRAGRLAVTATVLARDASARLRERLGG
jgi:CubicO group peptidase (beta-lactamase class C family)